jgi:hypothetical protein
MLLRSESKSQLREGHIQKRFFQTFHSLAGMILMTEHDVSGARMAHIDSRCKELKLKLFDDEHNS